MDGSGASMGSSGNWNEGSVGVQFQALGGFQLSRLSTLNDAVEEGIRLGVLALVVDLLLCGRCGCI